MKHSIEHGDYVVSRSLQTIMFSARGPWNDETMKRGAREMGENIAQLDLSKPWGTLSCLYGESLMPPSTFNSFAKHTLIRKSMGLKALAVVILDSDIANTIKNQLTPAYQEADLKFAFLPDINSAIAWLSEINLDLEQQQVQQFFEKHSFIYPNRK
ncbi:hypothetical protein [uncultured Paraglaciecola sp.]|uniref:hypothetical protein n=1 Tax=uncultured Paraglaciecola sp. TaxID=1765024 RepID=UPI0030D79EE0|tara:strand:+ start:52561 stop:53028 length:468 start_codon:yes stop_codon:yes gene_type:complete